MNIAANVHQQGAGLLNAFLGKGRDKGLHLGQMKSSDQALRASQTSVSLSLSEASIKVKGQSFKILGRELEARFEGASLVRAEKTPQLPAFEPPSPEEVAGKVLGFVEGRLKAEAESGASQERLADLLKQAQKGVDQGFGEAREQIKSLGLMNEELGSEIDKSYELIGKGLEGFKEKYLAEGSATQVMPSPANLAPSANASAETAASAPAEGQTAKTKGQPLPGAYRFGVSAFSGQSSSSAIEITTRDGDKIKIQASTLSASFAELRHRESSGSTATRLSAGQIESASFGLSVEGELDEGELTALQDLLAQVQELSDQFFSGDFQGAFERAMQLGYDGNEIADFSLNLSQTQVQQVSAYEKVSRFGESDTAAAGNRFKPLASFASGMGRGLAQAGKFQEPARLMEDLLQRFSPEESVIGASRKHDAHRDFFSRLIEKLA